MNEIIKFLQSTPAVIAIITIAVGVLSKSIIKIFNYGVTFRNKLVSKEELDSFIKETDDKFKDLRQDIKKDVLDTCMRILERELKSIEDIRDMAVEMEKSRNILEVKMDGVSDNIDDVRQLGNMITSINNRLTLLEYGKDTTVDRRRETK